MKVGVIVENRSRSRTARRAFWGIVLIGAGVMLMLDQLGILSLGFYAREWWTWWPVLLIASGLASLVAPDGAKEAFKGLSLTLLGLWALACSQHWYGFSWGRSWPLVLVVVGLESILLAAFDRRSRAQAEKEAHDVGAA